MRFQKLFEPIRIGKVKIRNRVAMAPMLTQYSDRGYVSEQQLAYYAARARGGAGLIITEVVFTSRWAEDTSNLNILGLYDMTHMPSLAALVDTIHAFGAKTFVQFSIGLGVQGSSRRTGVQPVGPSTVNYEIPLEMVPRNVLRPELAPYLVGEVPREMTIEEIERERENFVKAAVMAGTIGFDGLEIHAANGFLLHDFLSPRFNRRTDGYGGTLENRMRLLLEIVRKTKAAVGNDMVVGVRASADEHTPGGTTYEDMKVVVQRLEQEGIDYFHVSDGCFEALKYTIPDEDGTMLDEAAGFKRLASLPIITPSIHDPEMAEKAVSEGMTDMVALGRQLIADPDWANKVKEGRLADIRRCKRCNRRCFVRLMQGLRIECVFNPESGLERYNPQHTRWAVRRRAIERRKGRAETAVVR